MDWSGVSGFTDAVKLALLDRNRRRAFVAVSKERDGVEGTVARTKVLYSLLDQYNIPYTVTPLSNERNHFLYDLVVVDEGVGLEKALLESRTFFLSDVVDVRVVAQPTGGHLVIGSIHGVGFKRGDVIIVNGQLSIPTTFGNDTWITFAMPLAFIGNGPSFALEVLRPRTLERSQPRIVNIKG